MENFHSYYNAMKYLESLAKPFGAVPDPSIYIKRTRHFLDLIGSPDSKMKIIHIAGTAGKGTTAKLIHGALVNQGYNAGLFTSPASTALIEEIQFNNAYITPQYFADLVNRLKPHIESSRKSAFGAPSFFEVKCALALLFFKELRTQYAVFEVGLGGRFDATNAIRQAVVTAITNINYDHTNILGKTLKAIARDKAGIIKKTSNFFTTEERPNLLKIFREICRSKNAKFHQVNVSGTKLYERNFILAKQICSHLGIAVEALDKSIKEFHLPGRFETINHRPRIILDGAHNVVKMKCLVERLKEFGSDKVILLLAIAVDKDKEGIMREIVPLARRIFVTSFVTQNRDSIAPEKLKGIAEKIKPKVKVESIVNPLLAFKKARQSAAKNEIVLVTGSFYLVEAVRKLFYPESFILSARRSR